MRKLLQTPMERVFFALSMCGASVATATLLWWLATDYWDFKDSLSYLTDWPRRGLDRKAYVAGFWAFVAGLLLTLTYERTIGRLLLWIRHGNAPRDH